MKIGSRHDLPRRELKKIHLRVEQTLGKGFLHFLDGKKIETCSTDLGVDMILVDSEPRFFISEKMIFPTLAAFLEMDVRTMPYHMTVDMGAVPFVVNGADVMRPGVKELDMSARKGDFVIITEQNHGRPLAVGILLYDASELMERGEGKVAKNLHFVGDKMWALEGTQ
jgi:PUA domain protein